MREIRIKRSLYFRKYVCAYILRSLSLSVKAPDKLPPSSSEPTLNENKSRERKKKRRIQFYSKKKKRKREQKKDV